MHYLVNKPLGRFSDYYGEFSEAALTNFSYSSNKQFFSIEQRLILKSYGPQLFIYPKAVRAYQKSINNGFATIVLPPANFEVACFAVFAINGMVLNVVFNWRVNERIVERILASLE